MRRVWVALVALATGVVLLVGGTVSWQHWQDATHVTKAERMRAQRLHDVKVIAKQCHAAGKAPWHNLARDGRINERWRTYWRDTPRLGFMHPYFTDGHTALCDGDAAVAGAEVTCGAVGGQVVGVQGKDEASNAQWGVPVSRPYAVARYQVELTMADSSVLEAVVTKVPRTYATQGFSVPVFCDAQLDTGVTLGD